MECALYRFARPLACGLRVVHELAHEYLVDNDVYVVLGVLLQLDSLTERQFLSVYDGFFETFVEHVVEKLVVLTFPTDDDGRADAYFCVRDAFYELACPERSRRALWRCLFSSGFDDAENRSEYFLIRKFPHFPAARRAMRVPDARIENAQVVVYLRYRGHRRAGIVGAAFLVDGNCRRKSRYLVYVGLLHLP